MNIPKSTDRMSTLLIIITLALMIVFILSINFLDVSNFIEAGIYIAMIFMSLSLLIFVLSHYLVVKKYKRIILSESLMTYILPEYLRIEHAETLYSSYNAYHQFQRNIAIIPMTIIGLGFMIYIAGMGEFIAGFFFFFGFVFFGGSVFLMNYFKYLPPDLNDSLVVIGTQGILIYGKFHYWSSSWSTESVWLVSMSYEANQDKSYGVLTVNYDLAGSAICLEIPVPNEVSDQIPKVIEALNKELQNQTDMKKI